MVMSEWIDDMQPAVNIVSLNTADITEKYSDACQILFCQSSSEETRNDILLDDPQHNDWQC